MRFIMIVTDFHQTLNILPFLILYLLLFYLFLLGMYHANNLNLIELKRVTKRNPE